MRKLFVLTTFVIVCLVSCTTPTIEEEIFNSESNEIFAVDRTKIERPGGQGS